MVFCLTQARLIQKAFKPKIHKKPKDQKTTTTKNTLKQKQGTPLFETQKNNYYFFRIPLTAFSPKTTKASLRQDLADESADRHLPRIPLLDLVEQQRGRMKAAVTLGERFYWCFFNSFSGEKLRFRFCFPMGLTAFK